MKKLYLALALLFTNVSQAALIDFEEIPVGFLDAQTVSQGFRFSSGVWETAVLDMSPQVGTRSFYLQPWSTVLIDRPDGELFSLSSVVGLFGPADIMATGYFSDGSSISVQIGSLQSVAANLVYSDVNAATLRMYQFDGAWTGLSSVRITPTYLNTGSYEFDNFVMAAVPLPAAAWFFVSGFTVLAGLKRRRV